MEHEAFLSALERMGLTRAGESPDLLPLTDSVPCETVRVDLARGPVCIKSAVPGLDVEGHTEVPMERNRREREWMRTAARFVPKAVPRIVAEDAQSGMFAMEYLERAAFPVWEDQLRDGTIETGTSAEVGRLVAAIHGATAGHQEVEQAFRTGHIFVPIRLDPFLRASALKHPECADQLEDLARHTASVHQTLVHGDLSPKNILIGPSGPVFLGAQWAWYGDPAFDLAFCLSHLLLKCIGRPQWTGNYLACYDALVDAYLSRVTWETIDALERRTAHMLPGLLLGQVDGKSTVASISEALDRERARDVAVRLLRRPVSLLSAVRDNWRAANPS